MQTAKSGDTVLISYTVQLDDGQVVGGTEQEGPQTLTLGQSQIFPQIEAALAGMEVGSEASVKIPSDDAFGPRRDEMAATSMTKSCLARTKVKTSPGFTL